METAYVLINCDMGYEEQVTEELNDISDVKEVHGTYGAYDILAKVESEQTTTLRETITGKIRKINRVTSTLTLMAIENQD